MSRIRNKAHIFLNAYERMNSIMEEKFNYSLHFIGGTLLGYIRENDFLEHDKDMDVSYFSRFTTGEDVQKEIIEIIDTLLDSGEDLYFIRENYSIVNKYFRWKVDEIDRIDIMPTWYQEGMIYRPTFVAYKGNSDIILPLRKEKFYDHDVYIPNKPEIKLANVYGENWRTPDRGFKKSSRRNDYTSKGLGELAFYSDAWEFAKRTRQWKEFSLVEKLFMHIIVKRKVKFIAKILPNRKWFKKKIFLKLRKWMKKGRI